MFTFILGMIAGGFLMYKYPSVVKPILTKIETFAKDMLAKYNSSSDKGGEK